MFSIFLLSRRFYAQVSTYNSREKMAILSHKGILHKTFRPPSEEMILDGDFLDVMRLQASHNLR